MAIGFLAPGREEMGMGAEEETREALRRQARMDDPLCETASADMEALDLIDGDGSAAEAEAIKRRDFEAWIPGLEARPTVMRMGWTIFAAVLIANALSWLPLSEALYAVVNWTAFGIYSIAVAAAVWSILSEVRGWEGSNAAYWFRKGRVKRYRKARDARHREIGQTLIAVGDKMLTVYRMKGGIILPQTYAPYIVKTVAVEPSDTHMTLKLATATETLSFDWLPRNVAFEAAIGRFSRAARDIGTALTTEVA